MGSAAGILFLVWLALCLRICSATGVDARMPATAIQPLYVCKVWVPDLPEYTGTPTPEMQAATIGLSTSLEGMLWYDNEFDSDDGDFSPPASKPVSSQDPPPYGPIKKKSPSPAPPPSSGPTDAPAEYIIPHGSTETGASRRSSFAVTASADDAALASNFSPRRSLLADVSAAATQGQTCNKGSPTDSSTGAVGRSGFGPAMGFKGISMASTNALPPDPAIAVGPDTVLHVVNSLVAIYNINSGSGGIHPNKTAPARLIPLPDFFTLVATPCDGGYYSPSASYDKQIGRFLLTAICGGDANQVLLAISANSSALGSWILYSFAGEVTQRTPMQCRDDYPMSLHSKVTYNKDGVYISFVQTCPSDRDYGTGAVLYALPKWAVYKGATYFWVPVWTAWDVYYSAGVKDVDDYVPGNFRQLQPVMPQTAAGVQQEVVYFVSDDYVYNYAAPQPLRDTITLTALINTGSLWLYEGPSSNSPAPLLVARIVPRGMTCMVKSSTKLTQPASNPGCQRLHPGAMRPPGFWDGGAALNSDKIYLADRGPDKVDMYNNSQPTIYWAVLTPSFCVSGPCALWFGSDWGWSDGWDWSTGTWAATSDRGRNSYRDPSYYNQVYLLPSGSATSGRRLQQTADLNSSSSSSSSSEVGISKASSKNNRRRRRLASDTTSPVRDALGVPAASLDPGMSAATASEAGPISAAAAIAAAAAAAPVLDMLHGPVSNRQQLLAAVQASLVRMEAMRPITDTSAAAAADAAAAANSFDMQQPRSYKKLIKYPGSSAGPRIVFRTGYERNSTIAASSAGSSSGGSSSAGSSSGGSSRNGLSTSGGGAAASASRPPAAAGTNSSAAGSNITASMSIVDPLFAAFVWKGFMGWGYADDYYYYDYYSYWRDYYFLRNLYISLTIPSRVNPCKYYQDWKSDNTITFGAIVSRSGVLDFSNGQNPIGLAFPQVAVRGGSLLVVYSYAGPQYAPDESVTAYPGVGYTAVYSSSSSSSSSGGGSGGSSSSSSGASSGFNLVKAGAACIYQRSQNYWGSYSGIDAHFPSYKIWSAVEYAATRPSDAIASNAATWLSVLL